MKIIFTLIFSFIAAASFSQTDSTLKPSKFVLKACIGNGLFRPKYNTTETQKMHNHVLKNNLSIGLNYLIPGINLKRNQLFVTATVSMLRNQIVFTVNNYTQSGHSGPSHTFSQNDFEENYYVLSPGLGLTQMISYKNVILFQSLGVTYNKIVSGSTVRYTELVSGSNAYKDPSLVSSNNPDGWYWVSTSETIEHKEEIEYSVFNPYYQFGLGWKLSKCTLFGNLELTGLSQNTFQVFLTGQLGVFYPLK